MKLTAIALALLLAGCATTRQEPVTQHEAAATSAGNCATAIRDIAVSVAGDAASKVAAVGAIERLCGSGAMFAGRQAEPSTAQTIWGAVLSVADIAMRGYGIRANRDVGIVQSNNAAQTTIAGYQSFSNIAGAGFQSNTGIAGHIQAPAPNLTTSYSLGGSGVIGSGSFSAPVTNTTNTSTVTTTQTNPSPTAPRVCGVSPTGTPICSGG